MKYIFRIVVVFSSCLIRMSRIYHLLSLQTTENCLALDGEGFFSLSNEPEVKCQIPQRHLPKKKKKRAAFQRDKIRYPGLSSLRIYYREWNI